MPKSKKTLGTNNNATATRPTPKKSVKSPRKRVDPYHSSEFTQRLIDHMHQAKIAALSDVQE